jgi:hypothetical protein
MSHMSVLHGYIHTSDQSEHLAENQQTLTHFPYDVQHPFTDIFHLSKQNYFFPVIGFCGNFKQIEDDLGEWFGTFYNFLYQLHAFEAKVYLECILGNFYWHLQNEAHITHSNNTLKNQPWYITEYKDISRDTHEDVMQWGNISTTPIQIPTCYD